MTSDKVYLPETIAQQPFPGGTVIPAGSTTVKTSSDETPYTPSSLPSSSFPSNRPARAVISESINTQQRRILGNYTFGVLGAVQIGKSSGANIKISPSGIVGTNASAVTTFTLDGTTGSLSLRGTIVALAGTIGGFTINTGYLEGTDVNTCGMAPADYPFYAGATYANRATALFRVTSAGGLTATSADITGKITATSGTIGGWAIDATTLKATSDSIVLDSTGSITIASTTQANAKLKFGGTSKIWEDSDAKLGFNAIGGEMHFYTNSTEILYLGTGNALFHQHLHCPSIDLAGTFNEVAQSEGSIFNVDIIQGSNDIRFHSPTGDYTFFKNSDIGDSVFRIDGTTGQASSEASSIVLGGHTLTLTGDVSLP